MNLLEAILLGLLQGVTEFLPISSSGHLVLAQHWLGVDSENLLFSVVVHVATLCATLVVLRRQVGKLIGAVIPNVGPAQEPEERKQNQTTIFYIFITTFVTGLLGLMLEDFFKTQFQSIQTVAYCLLATGGILLLPTLIPMKHIKHAHQLGVGKSFLMGLAQTLAIMPGISRSGTTIVAGLGLGLTRKDAGEYAFLISIPIILAALLLEIMHLDSTYQIQWMTMLIGFGAAFVSGIFALKLLLSWVQKGALYFFTCYCWLLALAILLF